MLAIARGFCALVLWTHIEHKHISAFAVPNAIPNSYRIKIITSTWLLWISGPIFTSFVYSKWWRHDVFFVSKIEFDFILFHIWNFSVVRLSIDSHKTNNYVELCRTPNSQMSPQSVIDLLRRSLIVILLLVIANPPFILARIAVPPKTKLRRGSSRQFTRID